MSQTSKDINFLHHLLHLTLVFDLCDDGLASDLSERMRIKCEMNGREAATASG